MPRDLNDQINKDSKAYGIGGQDDRFKPEDGVNKVRVLDISKKPLATHWIAGKPIPCVGKEKGCPWHGEGEDSDSASLQYVAYVLDRADNKVKTWFMPYSVFADVAQLQKDEDYAFEDFPMEYDLKVTYDSDAAPAKKYNTLPSPERTEVNDEFMEKIKQKTPLDQVVERIKEKQIENNPIKSNQDDEDIPVVGEDGEEESEEIPF